MRSSATHECCFGACVFISFPCLFNSNVIQNLEFHVWLAWNWMKWWIYNRKIQFNGSVGLNSFGSIIYVKREDYQECKPCLKFIGITIESYTEFKFIGYLALPCPCTYRLTNQKTEQKLLNHSVAQAGFWAGYSIPLTLPRVKSKHWPSSSSSAAEWPKQQFLLQLLIGKAVGAEARRDQGR